MKRLNLIVSGFVACNLLVGASLSARPQSSTSSDSSAVKKTSNRKKHRRHHEPKQMAPTPDRISEIQSALARDGYYKGDPNGKWDSATVGAMEKFQADHGLDSTGKIDALTLQKLGLGSDIAGVDAPRAPAPATDRSTQPPATPKPESPKPAGTPGTTPSPVTPQPSRATPNPDLPR